MKRFVIQKKYKKTYKGERNSQFNSWCNHRCYETVEARDRNYLNLLNCETFEYRKKVNNDHSSFYRAHSFGAVDNRTNPN